MTLAEYKDEHGDEEVCRECGTPDCPLVECESCGEAEPECVGQVSRRDHSTCPDMRLCVECHLEILNP